MKKWLAISVLALSVMFCNVGAPNEKISINDEMLTALVAASTAVNVPTEMPVIGGPDSWTPTPGPGTPTAAPQPKTGTVTGKLSYPAETIPPLRVTAFDVKTGKVKFINTEAGDNSYKLELSPGTYHIVAYVIPYNGFPEVAGGYTRAVPCGLAIECADHGYIEVTVVAGETVTGIDPADFYAEDGTFPPMPGQ